MSHMIERNMMSWKETQPWHGLGVEVNADASGIEMLKAAGMDWTVQRRMLAMRNGQGQELLTEPLKGFRAIVRSDTDEVFQVATDRYHVVQNQDIIEVFRQYCEAGHARMETVGALKGGGIVWALARLNSGTTTTLQGGDELRGYLLMATSHDGSLRTIAKPTQVRVVCWNTLSASLRDGKQSYQLKHTAKWTPARTQHVREELGIAVEQIQATNAMAERLSQVTIDQRGRLEFLTRVMGGETILEQVAENSQPQLTSENLLDAIVARQYSTDAVEHQLNRVGHAVLEAMISSPGSELASARNTLWGAVNGVTYYADHERGRTDDSRMASAWFGDSDRLKSTALQVAGQMAGIQ
jgi:phage/plasmid-like protein (TIGR03299 family)